MLARRIFEAPLSAQVGEYNIRRSAPDSWPHVGHRSPDSGPYRRVAHNDGREGDDDDFRKHLTRQTDDIALLVSSQQTEKIYD